VKKFNYGSSDYDVRHALIFNYVWMLPIKRFITRGHGPSRLVEGWQVSGDGFLRTGFPITPVDVATSTALEGGGYGSGNNAVLVFATQVAGGFGATNCQAAGTANGYLSPQPGRGDCFLNANFTLSPNGFPDLRRNTFRGPGYWSSDFSIMKHTQIWERVEFNFGAQFYNVFNHANFDSPVMNIADRKFGQILKTVEPPTTIYGSVLGADASPRLIQFKTQIIF